jgi:hypothetical protein
MEKQDIMNFRDSLANMSVEELEDMMKDLKNQLNKMILDSDLIIKVAIVDQKIKDKKGESDGEVK